MATDTPTSRSRASGPSDVLPLDRLPGTHRTLAHRTLALRGIVLGTVGIAVAYGSAFGPPAVAAAGPWIMAVALPVMMVALMAFGAVRAGQPMGALAAPFAIVIVLMAGGFLAALALPPDRANGAYWLGLPRRAAVIVYGVGLLPMFLLPLVYASTFDALTLGDADIERIRAQRVTTRGTPGSHT